MQRRRNRAVVISRLLAWSFFSLDVSYHVAAPQFQDLIDREHFKLIEPLIDSGGDRWVCMHSHHISHILEYFQVLNLEVTSVVPVLLLPFLICFFKLSKLEYQAIRNLMDAEDPRIAMAFEAKVLYGDSVKMIAADLGVSKPKVYQLIKRAKVIGRQYRKDNDYE